MSERWFKAWTVVLLAFVCGPPTLSAARQLTPEPRSFVLLPADFIPAEIKWMYGHALIIRRGPTRYPGPDDNSIVVLDRSGREVMRRAPGRDIPGAVSVLLSSVTLSRTLLLTVSVSAVDVQGRTALSLVQYHLPTGRVERIIRTNPIHCISTVADVQDSIWCIGPDVEKFAQGSTDFRLVHKFSAAGSYLTRLIERGAFSGERSPLDLTGAGYPKLTSHGNQVWAIFPAVGAVFRWTLDGKVVQDATYPVPSSDNRSAEDLVTTDDGRMVAMRILDISGPRPSWRKTLLEIVPGAPGWRRFGNILNFPPSHRLAGIDGTSFVFWDMEQRSLVWLTP